MKIVLADSNELIRLGIRSALQKDLSPEIVGEANSSEELLDIVRNFETELLVVDYTSDGFTIDVVPQVLNENSNLRILAITPEQSAQTLVDALRS